MRVLAINHERNAGPGVFAEVMRERADELDEWFRPIEDEPPRDPDGYDAVLTFGGAMNTDQEERHPWLREEKAFLRDLIDREVPLLGVCLGSQLVAEAAGSAPRPASEPEIGWHDVEVTAVGAADALLAPLAPRFEAFQWHGYESPLPPGAVELARSPVCVQAYRVGERAWGIQFHAEVTGADAEEWTDDYRSDPDAVRIDLDPEALRAETKTKIAAWNQLGRELCGRFLDVATPE